MKVVTITLVMALGLAIVACGPAVSNLGLTCAEECAMTFSRENTKCRATHGRESKEGLDCSKLALSTNDQCAARCNGDL